MKKLNKKQLSAISLGLMGLAALLWLVMGSVKVTVLDSVSANGSGLEAMTGIEYEGVELVGFNFVALLTIVVALCAGILAFKSHKAAPGLAVLAAVLFIVVGFTMPLGYTSELREIVKLAKSQGIKLYKWGPAAGSYIAAILCAGSAALQVFGPKYLLAEEAPAE